ncbi:(2Fe-2S) ferredoxin domain-containing protein [Paenochrobactrum sp. BZR 588]|uniref:(2Fe-2S) ferredoxin domain-containing protein n=1 Tax=Paenochrobactrum TaxID=999488 RepID=UPI0035BC5844
MDQCSVKDNQSPAAPVAQEAVILLAKSAFAAAPHQDMQRLAELAAVQYPQAHIIYAFSEQGRPSFKQALLELSRQNFKQILVLPLVLPMEPSFQLWITKMLRRWQQESDLPWPEIKLGATLDKSPYWAALLKGLLHETAQSVPLPPMEKPFNEGSLIPAQKYRMLVCEGRACQAAGADAIWCHLRNEQERQKLRIVGEGMMSAQTSCLGPCNLAPVVQVFPDGTWYGGVTEQAIDRIISEHLLQGLPVNDFAYSATGKKQRLRG